MNRPSIHNFITAATIALCVVGLPGCGESGSGSSGGTSATHGQSGAAETGLAGMNREWIASMEAWAATAREAGDLFAEITDDASAEARLDALEALHRRVAGEQGGWQMSQFGDAFDSDALLAEWERAEAAFEAERQRLREERGRVYQAARDNSAMEDAVMAFPHQ